MQVAKSHQNTMVESNAFQVQLHQSAQTRKAFVNQNWCFYMACENCLWGEVTSQVPRPTLRTVCLSSQSVNQIGKWFTRPVTEASSCQQGHPSQARKPFAANYKVKPSRELHFFQTPLSALPFLALPCFKNCTGCAKLATRQLFKCKHAKSKLTSQT